MKQPEGFVATCQSLQQPQKSLKYVILGQNGDCLIRKTIEIAILRLLKHLEFYSISAKPSAAIRMLCSYLQQPAASLKNHKNLPFSGNSCTRKTIGELHSAHRGTKPLSLPNCHTHKSLSYRCTRSLLAADSLSHSYSHAAEKGLYKPLIVAHIHSPKQLNKAPICP